MHISPDEDAPYFISYSKHKNPVPILISVPHAGTQFPPGDSFSIADEFLRTPPDTDWFVDRLYDFAPELGITLLSARYSRYLIDLNRAADNTSLYQDQRYQSGLVPRMSFAGESIHTGAYPDAAEIQRRLDQYYWPYYQKIETILSEWRKNYPAVLFFDAHSIKRHVPLIYSEKLPSLILGNRDTSSAASSIIECAWTALKMDNRYDVAHNFPFKGGNLTRYFGRPQEGIHALQLEMSQDIYMDEETLEYNPSKAEQLRGLLQNLFVELIAKLKDVE